MNNVHVMPQVLRARALPRASRARHTWGTRGALYGALSVHLFDMEPARVELGHVRVLRNLAGAEQYLGSCGSGLGAWSSGVVALLFSAARRDGEQARVSSENELGVMHLRSSSEE